MINYQLQHPCRCGSTMGAISLPKGKTVAAISCARCEEPKGRLSQIEAEFVRSFVGTFGVPAEPFPYLKIYSQDFTDYESGEANHVSDPGS